MLPGITIRQAAPEDAEQVALLRRRISKSPGNKNPPLDPYGDKYPSVEQQETEINNYNANGIFLVALYENKLIGLAFCFEGYERPGGYGLNFQVDNQWRRKGIGSSLVGQVVEWAKSNPKVRKLICSFHSSHKAALKVCRKSGFQVTRKGFYPFIQGYLYHRTEMTLSLF